MSKKWTNQDFGTSTSRVIATRKCQDKGSGTSVKELPRDKTFKMEILN
jgi:hypothetical protein